MGILEIIGLVALFIFAWFIYDVYIKGKSKESTEEMVRRLERMTKARERQESLRRAEIRRASINHLLDTYNTTEDRLMNVSLTDVYNDRMTSEQIDGFLDELLKVANQGAVMHGCPRNIMPQYFVYEWIQKYRPFLVFTPDDPQAGHLQHQDYIDFKSIPDSDIVQRKKELENISKKKGGALDLDAIFGDDV